MIAGLFYLDSRPTAASDLAAMLGPLAHRDNAAVACHDSDTAALAMLVDISKADATAAHNTQIRTLHNTIAVTADARIDNHRQLVSALAGSVELAEGAISVDQVIAASYARWGSACVEHLRGDFAFAIWDRRLRTLFCARDHFGVKPLYYAHVPGHLFAFATEIRALLRHPLVDATWDEVRIGDYLALNREDVQRTFFRGVRRLPPAHNLQLNNDRLTLRRYWRLPAASEPLELPSAHAYAERLRETLQIAVDCRLDSPPTTGTLLSGGLDSSAITALARASTVSQHPSARLPTFSAVFDEVPSCDDGPFAALVVDQGGIDNTRVRADLVGALQDRELAYRRADEPIWAPNLFVMLALYREAAARGARTLLEGFDGDNVVSHGAGRLAELAARGHWLRLWQEARAIARGTRRSALGLIGTRGIYPWAPGYAVDLWRTVRGPTVPPFVAADFARRIGLGERIRQSRPDHRIGRRHATHHRHRLSWGSLVHALEISRHSAAAFGIEPRFPFLDLRVVELTLRIPSEQVLDDGWTRLVLRRAVESLLPPEVTWRQRKSDLSPNFLRVVSMFDLPTIEQILRTDAEMLSPYVNIRLVSAAFERYKRTPTWATLRDVWTTVTLGLWLRSQVTPSSLAEISRARNA